MTAVIASRASEQRVEVVKKTRAHMYMHFATILHVIFLDLFIVYTGMYYMNSPGRGYLYSQ